MGFLFRSKDGEGAWREVLRKAGLQGCTSCPDAGRPSGINGGCNAACFCGNPPSEVSTEARPGIFYRSDLERCPKNKVAQT